MSSFDTRRESIRRQMETMSQGTSSRRNNGSPARRRGSKSPKPLRGTRSPGVSQLNMESARRFLYEDEKDVMATPKMNNHKAFKDDPHSFFDSATDNDQSQNLWTSFRPSGTPDSVGESTQNLFRGDGIHRSKNGDDTGRHDSDADFEYRPSIMTSAYVSLRRSLANWVHRSQSYRYGIRSRYGMVMANGRGKKCFVSLFVFLALLIPCIIVLTGSSSSNGMPSGERYDAMSSRILDSGLSLKEDLTTEGRAQFQALEWIANTDPAQLDADDPFLLQRYSLAVFYYSTHGEFMSQSVVVDLKMNGTDEDLGDEAEPEADEVYGNKTSDNVSDYEIPDEGSEGDDFAIEQHWINEGGWLSGRGICSWYGVACHHRRGSPPTETVYDENNGLIFLNMTQNNVRGSVPRELFLANQDIRWLSLDSNGFFGTVPTEIGLLTDMRYMSLANNFFEGTFPSDMVQMAELERLFLEGNYLEGSIPDTLGALTGLRALSAYNNYLTGTIPDLSAMENLTSLYLDLNYLSGSIPPSIGALQKLVDLRLRQNNLVGPIPSSISQLLSMEVLYIDRNQIDGTIPTELGLLGKRLEDLHLHDNQLTGTIPRELSHLRNAATLYLDNNMLTGAIPTEIGTMNDLETLYMQRNRLTGPIPSEIGGMSNLQDLRAYTNGLMGPIPSEIAMAWKLENLFLQDNLLRGTFPTEVGDLTRLRKLRLYWNGINGEVPQNVCGLVDIKLVEFKVDCAGLDPQLACSCCTHCYS